MMTRPSLSVSLCLSLSLIHTQTHSLSPYLSSSLSPAVCSTEVDYGLWSSIHCLWSNPYYLTAKIFSPSDTLSQVYSETFRSVQFSRSVVSDSLRPHESQYARPPCPSPTPGVYSNSCPSSQ